MVHVQDVVLPAKDTRKSSCFQLKHEEGKSVIHVVDSEQWQCYPLDQLEMSCHEFHDSIAYWIESLLSKTPRDTSFGMLPICNIRYELFIEFLLYLLFSSHTFNNEQQGK